MKNYINDFVLKYDYPREAVKAIEEAYTILSENENFNSLLNNYYSDESINVDGEKGPLYGLCSDADVNFFTAKLVFYICLSRSLRQKYLEKGFGEDFWFENMADLKVKMMECFDVHNVWGIFSAGWFYSVFRMGTFTIGRLCYNVGEYDGEEITVADRVVKKGDKFISIHIPSSGKPFDRETRLESYKRASEFFGTDLFRCDSWLLYPPNREILKPGSNIISFMDDFKTVKSYEYKDNHIMWRIFGSRYELPPEKLPRDSSLRKAYADFMSAGNRPGAGVGYFILDSENGKIKK